MMDINVVFCNILFNRNQVKSCSLQRNRGREYRIIFKEHPPINGNRKYKEKCEKMNGLAKRTAWLVFLCLFFLTSCSDQTSKEEEMMNKDKNVQQQEQSDQKKSKSEKPEENNRENQPITIDVVDPNLNKIIKTIKPIEMGYGTDYNKYKKAIEDWSMRIARGNESKSGYDQRMIPDRIGTDGKIIKGKPRQILEESELIEKIINNSKYGGTVELPLYVTESGYKQEDVPYLGEVVVASYTTYFDSSVIGRSKNIELSAKAINNVILGKQDIFSFNTTVGPSDEAHGYQKAKEAVNGELVDGIGGGICQTSSTLYNAIDQLKVTYIEKHHHSIDVGYVPKGRDATVSYGGVDFRFQNTVGIPLLIKANVKGGSLTVEIRTSSAYKNAI